MKRTEQLPRGIRNNNPLNIRIGNVWLGEVKNPTDPEFEQFISMRYGLRAAFVILRRYIRRYHRDTIQAIISSWAPSNENATQNYINHVATRMGMSSMEPILYEDKETMVRLVGAMSFFENGGTIREDDISIAYDMA